MKTQEAVDYYGSKAAIGRVLGMSRANVSLWGEIVPIKHALTLNEITDGELDLVLADYRE